MESKEQLLQSLIVGGYIKHGTFTLKSGETSSIYADFRSLSLNPELFTIISKSLGSLLTAQGWQFDWIAGLPLGGISLAAAVGLQSGLPSVMIRKERKDHGRGKLVEADWDGIKRIVLVDDVLTTGSTITEFIQRVASEFIPLDVVGVVVLLNRSNLETLPTEEGNIPIASIYQLDDILPRTFEKRAPLSRSDRASELFSLMAKKCTNLCLSADVENPEQVLLLLDQLGPYIAVLKIHFDALDWTKATQGPEHFFITLSSLLETRNVICMADRKFSDIGSTVQKQIENHAGISRHLASLATVHIVAGPSAITQLDASNVGSVIVAEMSNQDSITQDETIGKAYMRRAANFANTKGVVGIVCQNRSNCEAGDGVVYMTPGVHLHIEGEDDQRYRTPSRAIADQCCDMIIVGRGIYNSPDPEEAARSYRDEAWAAYQGRCQNRTSSSQ